MTRSASRTTPLRSLFLGLLGIALVSSVVTRSSDLSVTLHAQSTCGALVNPIVCENQKPGDPSSLWDISGAGDATIQGFATSISVTPGQTESFKIKTPSSSYRIDIYRMGYYGGAGARKVATITPSAKLPQSQPGCLNDTATGLIDCGNWAVSGSWTVPSDAVSGIYFALLTRIDTGGTSHIVFIVRESDSASHHSDIVFQTSDTTWQAYNQYGGNSLYTGSPAGRAYKVSYNRPFTTRGTSAEDWVFNAEYPMVRFLESNGFDVSYITGVDTDRSGATILKASTHRMFMSTGHDEYWSGAQRANVETARGAGVHLAFFSGNEIFWKTRWESSIDASHTAYRTLVCYKETHANAVIDPMDPPTWTGSWRDPRFSPPADGGRPENALTGQLFMVNSGNDTAITVPAADGKMRFWRDTSVATLGPGATATLPPATLAYEWDADVDNGLRPNGFIELSSTTRNVTGKLLDYGSTFGSGTVTHKLSVYRHPSGALVFGAGTVQWSWGLDANHDRGSTAADLRMQQATINLFADMGIQPSTLQAGLIPESASIDQLTPTSFITSPSGGATAAAGTSVSISGTASENGGGVLVGVEVSIDGGATWVKAAGTSSWSYAWKAAGSGLVTIKSRGYDDSGNMEVPSAGVTINVTGKTCPCSIWSSSTTPPSPLDDGDTSSVELGLKFQTETSGFITGVRFYKAGTNTGMHTGSLWTSTGSLLGTVTFAGETASGWQQATFASPIAVSANTTYVVSYHAPVGHYTATGAFFASAGTDSAPLHALANSASGGNGVYVYGASASLPANTYNSSNYWVDVVFTTGSGTNTLPVVSVGNATVVEGDTGTISAQVPVTLSTPGTSSVTVAYATSAQTAAAGVDYTSTSGTVTIPAGATTQTISVPVIGDLLDEPNETFAVSLSNPTNATIGTSQGLITILDNDPLPSILVNSPSIAEGNSGSKNLTFTATLSAPSSRSVSFAYATSGGTATSGTDYTAKSGTVTFAAGTTTQTFTVAIKGDRTSEPDEYFLVNVSAPVNGTLGMASAKGTITNDD